MVVKQRKIVSNKQRFILRFIDTDPYHTISHAVLRDKWKTHETMLLFERQESILL